MISTLLLKILFRQRYWTSSTIPMIQKQLLRHHSTMTMDPEQFQWDEELQQFVDWLDDSSMLSFGESYPPKRQPFVSLFAQKRFIKSTGKSNNYSLGDVVLMPSVLKFDMKCLRPAVIIGISCDEGGQLDLMYTCPLKKYVPNRENTAKYVESISVLDATPGTLSFDSLILVDRGGFTDTNSIRKKCGVINSNLLQKQALDYMTSIQQQFHDKQYYQPLFSTMLLSRHCLMLPEESCGDQLRTKEQLGYIVFSGYDRSDYGSAQGFYITIQSSTKLDYVNLRIETYIDSIREYITTMSDDVYYKQREGYIIKKLEI
ncbi:unnamed protein product, partial [Didymodactylos carnosus]